MKSGVIVPVSFDRQNSRLLQIACHLHHSLRVGLLIKELGARVDAPLRVVIAERIDPDEPAAHRGQFKIPDGISSPSDLFAVTETFRSHRVRIRIRGALEDMRSVWLSEYLILDWED